MNSIKLNLRTNAVILAALIITTGCASAGNRSGVQAKPNTLTKRQIAQGFVLLFDGTLPSIEKNFKGVSDKKKVIKTAWIVRDGAICNPRKDKRSENISGSIVTKKQYANFDFRFDYKLDADGKTVNSGIKYFAYPGKELGLEYQLFNADAKVKGPTPWPTCTTSLPQRAGRPIRRESGTPSASSPKAAWSNTILTALKSSSSSEEARNSAPPSQRANSRTTTNSARQNRAISSSRTTAEE